MSKLLHFSNPVGDGESENQDDVMAVRNALHETGDLPKTGSASGWRDHAMDEAMEKVQRRNGLWPDRRMRPGGPTHRVIDAERKEKREGKKPTGLGLQGSVGPGDHNSPTDVRKVQTGLDRLGYLEKHAGLSGIYDQPTRSGLHRFQMEYNLRDDGVANPEGETDRMMARTSAPLAAPKIAKPRPALPGTSKSRSVADRLENAWDDIADFSGDIIGNVAEGALSTLSKAARSMSMQHGPDAVDHFLGGTGMDRQIPAAHTMGRHPVETGVRVNQKRFEDAFTTSRAAASHLGEANQKQDYLGHLEKMADGDIIMLPSTGSDYWENAYGTNDHFNQGRGDKPARFDPDEHFATGNSTFLSTASNGFTAVRRGDRIFVFGSVDHVWKDVNDYAGHDPLAMIAQGAQTYGDAKEYAHISNFGQRLEGELRIENGKIVPVHFRWSHLPAEASLR
ncbi:peptidoglycan-binding domain-containing protein [Minwuia sp.]|uniref:peptidoglycan-binding domain-containing protein n=1 Tax=Minwuia sp. TaxID=2493630 RepID=UPI003A90F4E1